MTTVSSRSDGLIAPHAAVLGRAAAVLAVGSALVHLLLVDLTALGSLAMVGMALVCLPCAWHLWRHPTGSVWALTAAADAAMLVLHAQMLSAPAEHVHPGAAGPGTLMWSGLALVAAQLLLAALAAVRR
ncbi:hypothetical protein [Blastococcus haudaquaticus]|uniref:hypothetical protein n=1 Tax=Blastococcus haudaquaticus TaxID=1938745 RepID=UPI000BE26615|nr:hypothetical protein [Blastococcus haudaquaticus]